MDWSPWVFIKNVDLEIMGRPIHLHGAHVSIKTSNQYRGGCLKETNTSPSLFDSLFEERKTMKMSSFDLVLSKFPQGIPKQNLTLSLNKFPQGIQEKTLTLYLANSLKKNKQIVAPWC
jgi:hypothetical protein